MKSSSLLSLMIVIIVIIGGIIIIIIRNPIPPEPPCLACIRNVRFLGAVEIVLGLISLGLVNRIGNGLSRG